MTVCGADGRWPIVINHPFRKSQVFCFFIVIDHFIHPLHTSIFFRTLIYLTMFARKALSSVRPVATRLFSSKASAPLSSGRAFGYAAVSALGLTVGYNYVNSGSVNPALGRLGNVVHLDGPTSNTPAKSAHPDSKANPNVSRDAKPSTGIEPAEVSSLASTKSRAGGGEEPTADITEIPQHRKKPSEQTKSAKPSSGIEPVEVSSKASTMSRVGGGEEDAPVRKEKKPEGKKSEKIDGKDEPGVSPEEKASGASEKGGDEEDKSQQAAYNEETGEINWDCPCLGGMAHGPCGPEFKEAFSCFVHSDQEPKGVECVEKFKDMQNCFRAHPDVYGEEITDDEESSDINEQQADQMGHLEEEAKSEDALSSDDNKEKKEKKEKTEKKKEQK